MGREIRRVPANWEHPKDADGNLVPLLDGYNKRVREWDEDAALWRKGLRRDYLGNTIPRDRARGFADETTYDEWAGERPVASDFMPDWPESERTHLQMYEDTTEGTPISPVMATPEELARWLADTGASAFGDMTASYEEWLATCKCGSAVSAVIGGGLGLRSGVALNAEKPAPRTP